MSILYLFLSNRKSWNIVKILLKKIKPLKTSSVFRGFPLNYSFFIMALLIIIYKIHISYVEIK